MTLLVTSPTMVGAVLGVLVRLPPSLAGTAALLPRRTLAATAGLLVTTLWLPSLVRRLPL